MHVIHAIPSTHTPQPMKLSLSPLSESSLLVGQSCLADFCTRGIFQSETLSLEILPNNSVTELSDIPLS